MNFYVSVDVTRSTTERKPVNSIQRPKYSRRGATNVFDAMKRPQHPICNIIILMMPINDFCSKN